MKILTLSTLKTAFSAGIVVALLGTAVGCTTVTPGYDGQKVYYPQDKHHNNGNYNNGRYKKGNYDNNGYHKNKNHEGKKRIITITRTRTRTDTIIMVAITTTITVINRMICSKRYSKNFK